MARNKIQRHVYYTFVFLLCQSKEWLLIHTIYILNAEIHKFKSKRFNLLLELKNKIQIHILDIYGCVST